MAIAKWAPLGAFASLEQEMRFNVSPSEIAVVDAAAPYRPRTTGSRGNTA